MGITRVNRKLNHRKVGPFLVKEKKSDVNFELELSNWIRIYPVFHIEKLEPADPETPIRTKESPKLSRYDEYKVEKIEDYDPKSHQYIVKWKRYPQKENTWEPIENLGNCRKVIRKSGYPLEKETTVRNPGPRGSADRQLARRYHQPRWS